MKLLASFVTGLALLMVPPTLGAAQGADITLLCAGALEEWMHEVIPRFEKTSGHRVKPTFAVINAITQRVRSGEPADLAVVSPQQWDDLRSEGKLDPAVRVLLAKVGYGVFIKAGATKPDIGSAEAFKRTLLNARSIALFDPSTVGPTAVYARHLFDRLGMTTELRPKFKYALSGAIPGRPTGAALFDLVAKGEAEIGIGQISETLAAPGVELAGPVPAEFQAFTTFATVIPLHAKEQAAAKSLIEFLASPEAASILKSKGLEPG